MQSKTFEPVAIISDIHADVESLNLVLADIAKRGIQRIYCLGDIVGYGDNPKAVIDTLRDKLEIALRGNHDHAAIYGYKGIAMNAIGQRCMNRNIIELYFSWFEKKLIRSRNHCRKLCDYMLANKYMPKNICAHMDIPIFGFVKDEGGNDVVDKSKLKNIEAPQDIDWHPARGNEYLSFLRTLTDQVMKVENNWYVHASPWCPTGITSGANIQCSGNIARAFFQMEDDTETLFAGHRYMPGIWTIERSLMMKIKDLRNHVGEASIIKHTYEKYIEKYDVRPSDGDTSKIFNFDKAFRSKHQIVGCVGSVSMGRDTWDERPSYVIDHGNAIEFIRVNTQ